MQSQDCGQFQIVHVCTYLWVLLVSLSCMYMCVHLGILFKNYSKFIGSTLNHYLAKILFNKYCSKKYFSRSDDPWNNCLSHPLYYIYTIISNVLLLVIQIITNSSCPPEKVVMATAMGGGEPKMLAIPMAILGEDYLQ